MKHLAGSEKSLIRIGVLANIQYAYGRDALRGVKQYLEAHREDVEIEILLHEPSHFVNLDRYYDGLIATIDPPELKQIGSGTPVVQLGGGQSVYDSAVAGIDNAGIGAIAAQALYHYGVVSFGYYDGFYLDHATQQMNSRERLRGFQEEIVEIDPCVSAGGVYFERLKSRAELRDWLVGLPKPAGVFAFNDLRANEISECCSILGLSIPEDVALVGVDNDQFFCQLNVPSLSSIDTNVTAVAYNATAKLLAQIDGGSDVGSTLVSEAPKLFARESTGVRGCGDDLVFRALDLMECNLCQKPNFNVLARDLGCSLRTLELQFRSTLGVTLLSEFQHLQLSLVKRMLRDTVLPIDEIAHQMQLELSTLNRLFKKRCRRTPGEYRKLFRDGRSKSNNVLTVDVGSNPRVNRIGLVLPLTGQSSYELLRGAQACCQQHEHVRLSLCINAAQPLLDKGFSDLEDFDNVVNCDAFVATENVDFNHSILGRKPIITLDHSRDEALCWQASVDNYGVGVLAAEYFLRKGFQQFAYCGLDSSILSVNANNTSDSRTRCRFAGYRDTLISNGVSDDQIHSMQYRGFGTLIQPLVVLPKRTGLFVFNDLTARLLIQQCYQLGISVPEDVAVLGCDNGEFLCELSSPDLSSVDINFFKAGYSAVEQLIHFLKTGVRPNPSALNMVARTVVERSSTNVLGVEDSKLLEIVEYIKTNCSRALSVESIVDTFELGRRAVEMRFKKVLPHSILDELHLARVRKASDLLTLTKLSIKEIAHAVGYVNAAHFSRIFRKYTRVSPAAFREERSNLI